VPIHIIRLRGPWECAPAEGEAENRVRYTRRFGLPTNLTPNDRVWVVVESTACDGAASLNDKPLGEIVSDLKFIEFDVTDHLLPRNILRLDIGLPQNELCTEQPTAAIFGEVRLEIRS